MKSYGTIVTVHKPDEKCEVAWKWKGWKKRNKEGILKMDEKGKLGGKRKAVKDNS